MIILLPIFSYSYIFNLDKAQINPKSIYIKKISIHNGLFSDNFSLSNFSNNSNFELLVYRSDYASEVFINNNSKQPKCCDESEPNCQSNQVIFNNNSSFIYRGYLFTKKVIIEDRIENNANQLQGEVKFLSKTNSFVEKLKAKHPKATQLDKGKHDYYFVIANCGSDPLTVSGNLIAASDNGYLDRRLVILKIIYPTFAAISSIYSGAWIVLASKKRPELNVRQYLFIGITAFFSTLLAFNAANIWIWDIVGDPAPFCSLTSVILTSIILSGLGYITLSGTIYPVDVKIYFYILLVVILSIFGFNEQVSFEQYSSRIDSHWIGGFSKISIVYVILISVFLIYIIIISVEDTPAESVDSPRSKCLLGTYSTAVVFYIISEVSNTVISYFIPNFDKFVDNYGLLILPLTMEIIIFANGYFWIGFDAGAGWQSVKNGDIPLEENDLGIEPDVVIGPKEPNSLIPQVKVKRGKGRKKKRSDGGFDIDDQFSGDDNMFTSGKFD